MTNGRVEIITTVQRRRRWSTAEKQRIVAASLERGAVASAVAREAGQLPSSCSPLLKAEVQDDLCRADYMPVSEKAGENECVRHSSVGGINRQAQRHRPARLARRRARQVAGPS